MVIPSKKFNFKWCVFPLLKVLPKVIMILQLKRLFGTSNLFGQVLCYAMYQLYNFAKN